MIYPIKQIPIAKFFSKNKPKFVVGHVDLGTFTGTVATLKGVKSASYHFYIPRNEETIVQFVQTDRGAWHAGRVSNPTAKAKKLFGNTNPNKLSIGICYEGKPLDKTGKVNWDWSKVVDGQKATKSQVDRTVWLLQKLGYENLPRIAHKEITSYKPESAVDFIDRVDEAMKGEHVCSLSGFTFSEIMGEFVKRLSR